MLSVDKIKSVFDILLGSDQLSAVAKEVGAFHRQRKLVLRDWLSTLIFRKDKISFTSLCVDYLALTGVRVSPQAMRVKTKNNVHLLRKLLKNILDGLSPVDRPLLDLPGIGDVHILDASTQRLDPSMLVDFPSTGGDAGGASLKLHVNFNLTTASIDDLYISSGSTPDRSFPKLTPLHFKPRDLVILDLGYFSFDYFRQMDSEGLFFLSRLLPQVNRLYNLDGEDFDLWQHLDNLKTSGKPCRAIEIPIGIRRSILSGPQRYDESSDDDDDDELLPCRLIATRLNREEYRKALKRLANNRRKKGTTSKPGGEKICLRARYRIWITNVDAISASGKTIALLYALRWQVELLFKGLKSEGGFKFLRGYRESSVFRAMLYARLIYSVTLMMIHRQISTSKPENRPTLLQFFIRFGQLAPQLPSIAKKYGLERLSHVCHELAFGLCCGGKRRRQTSQVIAQQALGRNGGVKLNASKAARGSMRRKSCVAAA